MKDLTLSCVFLLITANHSQAFEFYSFKKDLYYKIDGRFVVDTKKFYLKVNEKNGNEENLFFDENTEDLSHLVKYSLCVKVNSDCHLNCTGKILKLIRVIKPWEDPMSLITNPYGNYPSTSLKNCMDAE
jgi:hypothetical protein